MKRLFDLFRKPQHAPVPSVTEDRRQEISDEVAKIVGTMMPGAQVEVIWRRRGRQAGEAVMSKDQSSPVSGPYFESIEDPVKVISKALCQSRVFETGQGTCALVCMDQLGDARKKGCYHAERVHDKMAIAILEALVANRRGVKSDHAQSLDLAKFRKAVIEECALVAEGFDAACNSPRMKLFEEAGLVIAVYKRDGEIGAAIRALAQGPDTSTDRASK